MSGTEIRERIDANNEKIQNLLQSFILTNDIKNLLKENDEIRKTCDHKFVDDVCIYCDAFKGQVYD